MQKTEPRSHSHRPELRSPPQGLPLPRNTAPETPPPPREGEGGRQSRPKPNAVGKVLTVKRILNFHVRKG